MKYKYLTTEILPNSVQLNTPAQGQSTFQANITFEILPESQGVVIPDAYKTPTLTFFDLQFNTLNMETVLSNASAVGYAKLQSIYGTDNVTQ